MSLAIDHMPLVGILAQGALQKNLQQRLALVWGVGLGAPLEPSGLKNAAKSRRTLVLNEAQTAALFLKPWLLQALGLRNNVADTTHKTAFGPDFGRGIRPTLRNGI